MVTRKVPVAAVATILAALLAPAAAQAASPPNDDLANAFVIALGNRVTATNAGATHQAGEVKQSTGQTGTHSVWFEFTQPAGANRTTIVDTEGSAIDAVLTVFSGPANASAITQLSRVGSQDAEAVTNEHLAFTAQAGQTYYIAVDSYAAGDTGTVRVLATQDAPENDFREDARELFFDAGRTGIATDDLSLATPPTGTERFGDVPVKRTVWHFFEAPQDGRAIASVCQREFDSVVQVFAVTNGTFQPLIANDDTLVGCENEIPSKGSAGGFEVKRNGIYVVGTGVYADDTPSGGLFTLRITFDASAPGAKIVSGPPALTKDRAASFRFESTQPNGERFDVEGFECSLDNPTEFGPCPKYGEASFADVPDGAHTFRVRAYDVAGNRGAPAVHQWTVDNAPPDTRITAAPSGTQKVDTAEIAFDSEPGATYTCQLDGGAPTPCTSPTRYIDLADGNHTFTVRARDALGNEDATPASAAWSVKVPLPLVMSQGDLERSWAPSKTHLLIYRLAIRKAKVPKGTTVEIRCLGRRCPFRKKVRRGSAPAKDIDMTSLFSRKRGRKRVPIPLHRSSVLEITVTRPGTVGLILRFQLRKARAPKRTEFCVQPGARPAKCST